MVNYIIHPYTRLNMSSVFYTMKFIEEHIAGLSVKVTTIHYYISNNNFITTDGHCNVTCNPVKPNQQVTGGMRSYTNVKLFSIYTFLKQIFSIFI